MGRSPPCETQEESPDLEQEVRASGIEALPRRVQRYGKAKQGALDVAEYMDSVPGLQKMAATVRGCGDYLTFRHYYTIDEVRLHGASLCKKHLLCPLCAIRRGAKALKAYLDRWEVIRAEKPLLRPFLVTLTIKNGEDLAERFEHLHKAQHELWKRKRRGRGSVLDQVEGAVWSYEVKRGSGSGQWHPHLHMIALAEQAPDQVRLSREWHDITGDSFDVDVRPIEQDDPAAGFIEVFKYAVKFSSQEPADTVHCWRTLAGRRLIASAGCFWGVEVPEQLTDEEIRDLPYVDLFYRYVRGAGYELRSGDRGGSPKCSASAARVPDPARPVGPSARDAQTARPSSSCRAIDRSQRITAPAPAPGLTRGVSVAKTQQPAAP